ncbi:MAG: helix-turn-helix transcriptional regulator [Alphaproteobacteria bacterium]|nr:helix-turn-helix transcriptional regulator [Alphaproteobacteria bacterium]MCB9794677.1 helix-turn-helix transcriptional regulator [Alphaproteobacteria bacterium]
MAENDIAGGHVAELLPLEETIRRHVGDRLRMLREQSGLTQKELGVRAGGIKPGEISRYENAHRSPSLETMARLAEGLGISVSTLVDIEGRSEPVPGLSALVERVHALRHGDRAKVLAVMEALVREYER